MVEDGRCGLAREFTAIPTHQGQFAAKAVGAGAFLERRCYARVAGIYNPRPAHLFQFCLRAAKNPAGRRVGRHNAAIRRGQQNGIPAIFKDSLILLFALPQRGFDLFALGYFGLQGAVGLFQFGGAFDDALFHFRLGAAQVLFRLLKPHHGLDPRQELPFGNGPDQVIVRAVFQALGLLIG